MPGTKVKQFLNDHHVRYVTITHSPVYTAQEIAASAHLPGKVMAKTVMVKVDGQMAMAVLPAHRKIMIHELQEKLGAQEVVFATETEFKSLFPDCETGAMPPFGNLYNMPVFVTPGLAEDVEIAFNGGSHAELIKLAYADFDRLVQPKVVSFST